MKVDVNETLFYYIVIFYLIIGLILLYVIFKFYDNENKRKEKKENNFPKGVVAIATKGNEFVYLYKEDEKNGYDILLDKQGWEITSI